MMSPHQGCRRVRHIVQCKVPDPVSLHLSYAFWLSFSMQAPVSTQVTNDISPICAASHRDVPRLIVACLACPLALPPSLRRLNQKALWHQLEVSSRTLLHPWQQVSRWFSSWVPFAGANQLREPSPLTSFSSTRSFWLRF